MNQETRNYPKATEFTDLLVWKEGHLVVLFVYKLCKGFPDHEKFGLISQMERAAISVTSNIAEGFGRRNNKEKTQFYYISHGSLTELKNLLLIARDIGYVHTNDFNAISEKLISTQKLLLGLIKSNRVFS